MVSHVGSSNLIDVLSVDWSVLSQNLSLSPKLVLLVEESGVAGRMLGLQNMNLLWSSSLAWQVQISSLSVKGGSDSWIVVRAIRSVSVGFRDQIMDLLWLNIGVELGSLFLLKERRLFLGVEGSLALSNHWLKNAHSLWGKRAVSFGPLNTLVTSLSVEGSSGMRVVEFVICLVRLGPV